MLEKLKLARLKKCLCSLCAARARDDRQPPSLCLLITRYNHPFWTAICHSPSLF